MTIYKTDGSVCYEAPTAKTIREAVEEAIRAWANLTGANLTLADLTGANLTKANLTGANLIGAKGIIPAGHPDGWLTYGWLRDGALVVRVGCREFSLTAGRDYWRGKTDRREVMAALDYIEAMARIKEWIQ